MSYVAPVRAVLVMRWTASAATSAGPTTRRIGSVARSSSRRASSCVAEQRRRQRGVDEPGGDEVDADRRELEREVRRQGGQRGRERARRARGRGVRRPPVPPMKSQRAAGPHPADGVAGDAERQHHVVAERAGAPVDVHLRAAGA